MSSSNPTSEKTRQIDAIIARLKNEKDGHGKVPYPKLTRLASWLSDNPEQYLRDTIEDIMFGTASRVSYESMSQRDTTIGNIAQVIMSQLELNRESWVESLFTKPRNEGGRNLP